MQISVSIGVRPLHLSPWRTWALESAGEIEPPPIEYGTAAYWEQLEEIRRVASALTPAQMKIA
jgi:hypothetical protein